MSEYNNPEHAFDSPTSEPEKKPKGCLFYGCLFAGIAMALLLLLVIGGGVGGYFFLKGQVQAYTEEEPAEIPVVEASEEEVAELKSRVERLQQSVDSGEPADENEIVLTADDINALIASDEDLRGRLYVRIEDGEIAGDVSIPTDEIPFGEGRYFNASASFDVSMEGGVLIVRLKEATVKGEPIPDAFREAFANENLAQQLYEDADTAEKLRRFESIEVREDKLILRLKQADANAETAEVEIPVESTEGQSDDGE